MSLLEDACKQNEGSTPTDFLKLIRDSGTLPSHLSSFLCPLEETSGKQLLNVIPTHSRGDEI